GPGTSALPADLARGVRATTLGARLAGAAAGTLRVTGAAGSATALCVRQLVRQTSRPVVVVGASAEDAHTLAGDLAFVLGALVEEPERARLRVLAAEEASPYAELLPDRRPAQERLALALVLALGRAPRVLVASAAALCRKTLGRADAEAEATCLRPGSEIDRDAFAARLTALGYDRSPLVEDPATFALRGGLVDLWPAGAARPARVELYGELVMEIRSFDPEDQRSGAALAELWLPPAREAILSPERVLAAAERLRELCDGADWPSIRTRQLIEDVTLGRTFFGSAGYVPAFAELAPLFLSLPADALVVLDDPEAIAQALRSELARAEQDRLARREAPHFPRAAFYAEPEELARWLGGVTTLSVSRSSVVASAAPEAGDGTSTATDAGDLDRFAVAHTDTPTLCASDQAELALALATARRSAGHGASLEPLAVRIAAWLERGLSVVLAARTGAQAERLAGLLANRDFAPRLSLAGPEQRLFDAPTSGAPTLHVVVGPLARGVVAPLEGLVLVTEEEVFGTRAHRRKQKKRRAAELLDDLRALGTGDAVVHVEHGVGRYRGLVHREHGGQMLDLIVVEYAGGDKLYLPVYRLNQIQKFRGDAAEPKLDRLGGATFAKKKARAEGSVRQMADELLRLYAARQAAVGVPTPPPDADYAAFEASFPYEETDDQARAIAEVSSDLESARVMDRLVCGDVGFGKTEVALRAAMRVAASGRQVAVLCPTTVLAQQHAATFEARLADYPVRIATLSRFVSKRAEDAAVRGLRDGSVDIVIGTHRLLSKDVHFKHLGLLIVDEEQRFGVAHKERIKALKTNVDVLTLTATPIPRTLQMAMSGLRDLSLIATAPADRRAVRTMVTRFEEGVIREALLRELGRGGQAFYVYNRIEGLGERAERLRALVPRARIGIAHGQLGERQLERVMLDFVAGHYDVLCATAIIENGLDIPRCNTIFIDRPDLFGLGQLYQLRGRVGRARERAYCYLVLPSQPLNDEAKIRIEALERYSEVGSGLEIASLDLDLRGAGDLLGAEQSGAVASVGFELFCDMLAEAVAELRGEPVVHDVDPELSFDAEAYLPESYVPDVGVRLSLYKRLASAASADDIGDIGREIEDRFGVAPAEARRFLRLMQAKTELRALKVLGCEASHKGVTLHLRDDTPLDPKKLAALLREKASPYRLTPDMRLTRRTLASERFENGLEAVERTLAELARALG
ncbi:MAG: transcription-repair coupling factor, partial [Myxococcales bacterium]|nr:transcription-repair coupling factor [Myxococcales bacterium]